MIEITKADHQTMLVQLQAAYPLEACGIMAGLEGRVESLYPVDNRLASPYAFDMEPSQLLRAMLDLEEHGWELLAIYHSHPHGPEAPSSSDIAQAYYPEAAHVIVSLRERQHPTARAFTIITGKVLEIPYCIV